VKLQCRKILMHWEISCLTCAFETLQRERALSLDPLHPQLCFIRETLEKEVRLSYYDRVKTTLPDEIASLMASEPPAPSQELLSPDHPHHDAVKQLLGKLKMKQDTEALNSTLAEIRQRELDNGADQDKADEAAREIFTQAVLLLGSKSFSHVLNVIERYVHAFYDCGYQ
jgi:nuclear cap-binding protein subunit 1